MKKKIFGLVVAVALVTSCVVGGVLAWLTADSGEVRNVFTTSDIQVDLEETEGTVVDGSHQFQMIPGWTIKKDPKVTVKADSVDCYLFVKLDKSANFDKYMTYEMADGWTALEGHAGVYYREVTELSADRSFPVLKDDQVAVKETVTKADMADAKTSQPSLTIEAYASQLYKNNTTTFTPAEAWANAAPSTSGN